MNLEIAQKVAAMTAEGYTAKHIASELGVTPGYVRMLKSQLAKNKYLMVESDKGGDASESVVDATNSPGLPVASPPDARDTRDINGPKATDNRVQSPVKKWNELKYPCIKAAEKWDRKLPADAPCVRARCVECNVEMWTRNPALEDVCEECDYVLNHRLAEMEVTRANHTPLAHDPFNPPLTPRAGLHFPTESTALPREMLPLDTFYGPGGLLPKK